MDIEAKHIISSYDALLKQLHTEIDELFNLVLNQLVKTKLAFANHDTVQAKIIIDADKLINDKDVLINEICMALLIKQPVASDLRQSLASISISTNLERMGDNIRNVARVIGSIESVNKSSELIALDMMTQVLKMLEGIALAVRNVDTKKAHEVWLEDSKVDELYKKLCAEVVGVIKQNPENSDSYFNYFFVGRYLERVGDHIQNISEAINFSVTGERHHYG